MTLGLLTVIASTKAPAFEIYQWVDENGVPNYSQNRPAGNIPNVSKQILEDTALPGDGPVEDVYNVAAQEKRMTAWREERDQNRKDARERKRLAALQQPIKYQEPVRNFSRSYWRSPIYGRPGHKPPIRPPYRPPHQPQPPAVNPGPPSYVFPRGRSGSH